MAERLMVPRLVWIDDSDPELCGNRLGELRNRLSSWEFVRWDDSFYEDKDEAYVDLATMLGTKSMFSDGKVVYCFGIPSCQAKIAKQVETLAESVLFLIVGGIDKRTVLYKTASSMPAAEVDEPLVLKDKEAALVWLKRRAKELGITLEETAAKPLVDFVGPRPARLLSELKKLSHLGDGKVFPWMVDKACYVDGDEEITLVMGMLVNGDVESAHEFLDRMLAKNEPIERVFGFLQSWLRKMMIAESCKGDYQSIKGVLPSLMKYQKPENKDDSVVRKLEKELALTYHKDTKAISALNEKLEKEREKTKGKAVPMFPKPGAMYYACEDFAKANRFRKEQSLSRHWATGMMESLGKAQELVRSGKVDPGRALHNLLFAFSHDEGANC